MLYTNRGAPLIYYGDEIGLPGAGDPDNRRFMQWTGAQREPDLPEGRASRSSATSASKHPALRRGTRTTLESNADVWAYSRITTGDTVYVAVNRSDSAEGRHLDCRRARSPSSSPAPPRTGPTVTIPARQTRIFVDEVASCTLARMSRRVRSCLAPAFVMSLLAAVACGNKSEPATPSLSDPAHAADLTSPAGSSALPAASADPEGAGEEKHHRAAQAVPDPQPCTRVVTIVFGEDPKATGAGRRTIAPDSTIDGPRDAEGKQTVWLLDEKGEPLVKVHITRGMKQLEIGRSCRRWTPTERPSGARAV